MIETKTIGFIGGGNMGTALMTGLLGKTKGLLASDKDPKKLEALQKAGIIAAKCNREVAEKSDVVVLAVKPNMYPAVIKEIREQDVSEKLFISIAAGVSSKKVQELFGKEVKVLRAMPNTPALVGRGMTVLSGSESDGEEALGIGKEIFSAVGAVSVLPEKLMNAVTAVNGSSPAYVYMMIEAMADAAVRDGIPRSDAYRIAAESVAGAAEMVLKTGKHPGELKDAVCSPGGTTIAAVEALEENGFRNALIKAMDACTKKAEELGK